MTPSPGPRLGPYEVLEPLGSGGMGEVYRARDPRLGRDVAIKLLSAQGPPSPDRLRRFETEARAVASLSHPNVVTLFDVGTHDGVPYLVLELLEGRTLREALQAQTPTLRQAVSWALEIARGLAAAHERGIVHRDLKPDNVLLTTDGRLKILDFGLARLRQPTSRRSPAPGNPTATETRPGLIVGTAGYMAPEQVRGEGADARTDVFALGTVLFEMLTLHRPFSRPSDGESQAAILRDEPPPLTSLNPAVPPSLEAVVRRCLVKEPVGRFSSAREVAAALETVLAALGSGKLGQRRPPEPRGPYPGLSPFRETDAASFLGRESETAALWEKLPDHRLLAVIGPSGVGKTSFVRAGVVAARPPGWGALVCTPGRSPFRSLGRALAPELSADPEALRQLVAFDEPQTALDLVRSWRRAHAEVLLVVDQLEELFTLEAGEEQQRFADLLGRLVAEAGVHVLLSLRDDFLMRCGEHRALARVFTELTPLLPLSGDSLRRAVEEPAKREGYCFEEGLVEEMLDAVKGARGALPLLAFAVSRLWERRDRTRRLLTRGAYEEVGGVAGALAQHAEQTLERIGSEREPIVRELFRNLVTAQCTRASSERAELLSVFPEQVAAREALEDLIEARLLTSYEVPVAEDGRETPGPGAERRYRIEIVHESLMKAWPRLVWWQAQDEEGAQLRDQLRQAARLWEEKGRTDDLLWSGPTEREFEVWRERYPGQLTAVEDDFAKAMVERARKTRRIRRIMVAGAFAVTLIVALVTGTLWWRGEQARAEAVAEARRAEAGKLIALGQPYLDIHPPTALAFAVSALESADTEDARLLALKALSKGPPMRVLEGGLYGNVTAFSPDGTLFAASGDAPQVRVWSEDGGPPTLIPRPEILYRMCDVQFSSDRVLVTREGTPERGKAWAWSLPSGELAQTLDTGPGWLMARGSQVFVLKLVEGRWQVPTRWTSWPLDGGPPTSLGSWNGAGVGAVDVDGTGTLLAESHGDALFVRRLDDLEAPLGEPIGRHSAEVAGLRFDATGRHLAAADESGEFRVWDLTVTPARSRILPRPPEGTLPEAYQARWLFWDARGSRLAADFGEGVLVWDLMGPPDARPLVIPGRGMSPLLALHPSGRWLARGGTGSQAVYGIGFSFLGERLPITLPGHRGSVRGLTFAPDGRSLVSASLDRTLRVWPLTSQPIGQPQIDETPPLWGAVLDPQGRNLLTTTMEGGRVVVLPLKGGPPRPLEGFPESAMLADPAFGPEGRLAAVGSFSDPRGVRIRIWDLETGEVQVLNPLGTDEVPQDPRAAAVTTVAFTAEGDLVSSGASGLLRWDVETATHEVLREPTPDQAWMPMSMSGDRRHLLAIAAGGGQREMVLYDLETGASRVIDFLGPPFEVTALNSTGTIGVAGDAEGRIWVASMDGGEPHILFGHEDRISALAISSDDQWIASADASGTIRLWPMPDVSETPFHALPYERLMTRLRSLTNLRAAPDEPSPSGYKLEGGPFPGWRDLPEW